MTASMLQVRHTEIHYRPTGIGTGFNVALKFNVDYSRLPIDVRFGLIHFWSHVTGLPKRVKTIKNEGEEVSEMRNRTKGRKHEEELGERRGRMKEDEQSVLKFKRKQLSGLVLPATSCVELEDHQDDHFLHRQTLAIIGQYARMNADETEFRIDARCWH
jgi:hypothetical protein